MKVKTQFLKPSSQDTGSLQFQEFLGDERVERKRGSESQRLAETYREDRRFVVASLRGLQSKLREALV